MSCTSSSSDNNVLSFETAMDEFRAMFPDADAATIEAVLRKHDGDVSGTIDELLRRSCGDEEDGDGGRMKKNEREGKEGQVQQQPIAENTGGSGPSSSSAAARDPCAEDEKIALLIQNREFLRYLRHDPRFQRELLARDPHQHRRGRHHHHHNSRAGPVMPVLLSCSRPSQSPNTRRLFRRPEGGSERDYRIPDGPPVMAASKAEAIPEGPLIDYVDAEQRESGGWTRRLKAKLSNKPAGAEQLPPAPLVHCSDAELQARLQSMHLANGGSGRALLQGLARKFSLLGRSAGQRVRLETQEAPASYR